MARCLGLWHDIGKFGARFQLYLEVNDAGKQWTGRSPDHKAAGAKIATQYLSIAAMLIQGHHGGLKSRQTFNSWLNEKLEGSDVAESLRLAKSDIPDLIPSGEIAPPNFVKSAKDKAAVDFFLRFLFSCLVDADFLDTEAHFNANRSVMRSQSVSIEELWIRFQQDQQVLVGQTKPDSQVNQVRNDIYEHCLNSSQKDGGLFKLAVPTGGGKTRSAMAFALRHAALHGLERVVVAVPFTSVTEQTASVYREIFESPDDQSLVVLEHHSGSTKAEGEDGDVDQFQARSRLAAENWDAPIIVTTTVQLFESLFSNRVSKTRKLHNLSRAVIILDEAQGLPVRLLDPILDALKQLCDNYGSSIVLSTATQPAFEAIPLFGSANSREIVPDPSRYFDKLRRVEYEWWLNAPVTWEQVADDMSVAPQSLCIVNTKQDALDLLTELDDPGALHLSTNLCSAHRRDVVAEVKRRLKAGERCQLVSTQVVEAGIDLDFPVVFRALAPLDSIIQAAGRCNREGKLEKGRVVVFRPQEEKLPPGQYKIGTEITEGLLNNQLSQSAASIYSPEMPHEYFRQLFNLIETDREKIQQSRESLNFPEVDRLFRMIDSDTESVIIADYGCGTTKVQLQEKLAELRKSGSNHRAVMRELQPYIVSVYSSHLPRLRSKGLLSEVSEGVWEWLGDYNAVRGIGGVEGFAAESLVV